MTSVLDGFSFREERRRAGRPLAREGRAVEFILIVGICLLLVANWLRVGPVPCPNCRRSARGFIAGRRRAIFHCDGCSFAWWSSI
jgi:hypothetical protein